MRFIVDNSVSWRLAQKLSDAGHQAIHVRDHGLANSADIDIYLRAVGEDRIIVTQDVDFGHLLATSSDPVATVILFRLVSGHVDDQWVRLSMLLNQHAAELTRGTIVVLSESNIRIRRF